MPFLTATPWLLPAITAGTGIWSTIKGQQMQEQALAAAKEPRFTEAMADYARKSGTSNLTARLAERGMLDSSMLPGGIAELERGISETRAASGTQGDLSGMLSKWGSEMGLGGSETLGSMYEAYMLKRLLGDQGTSWGGGQTQGGQTPWWTSSTYSPYWDAPRTPSPYWGDLT